MFGFAQRRLVPFLIIDLARTKKAGGMGLTMVLIESNAERRKELATALRSTGIMVVAASRTAEVERWPIGEIVVAESSFFTPLWKEVGATHVVVLADSPALGRHAVASGASRMGSQTL